MREKHLIELLRELVEAVELLASLDDLVWPEYDIKRTEMKSKISNIKDALDSTGM